MYADYIQQTDKIDTNNIHTAHETFENARQPRIILLPDTVMQGCMYQRRSSLHFFLMIIFIESLSNFNRRFGLHAFSSHSLYWYSPGYQSYV